MATKSSSGVKDTDGIEPGIQSINGNFSPNQHLLGTGGTTVNSFLGTTTITSPMPGIQSINANTNSSQTIAVTAPITLTTGGGTNTIGLTAPLSVVNGGTGRTTLAQYNVMVGEGTGNMGYQPPGAVGNVLASNGTTAYPTFQTVTSVIGTLPVANGGTGGTTTGTSGTVLTSTGTSSVPTWQTPTAATSINATAPLTANGVSGTAESGAVTVALTTPVTVALGGTGHTNLTAFGVLTGGTTTTGTVQSIPPGTSGTVLTSAGSGAVPTWSNTIQTINGDSTSTQYINGQGGTNVYTSSGTTYVTSSVIDISATTSGSVTPATVLTIDSSSVPIYGSGTIGISYSGTALPLANGGTGLTAPSNYSLLFGSTGSALHQQTIGTSGTVLTSNGPGVAPAWSTPATGDLVSINGDSTPAQTIAITTPLTIAQTTGTTTLGLGTVGVANGGTGGTTTGTSGTVLTSTGTSSVPTWQTPTAPTSINATAPLTANGVSGTAESGAVTIALPAPLSVVNGGTGRTTLAQYNVMVGEGTGNMGYQPPGAVGNVLASNGTTSYPTFQTVTSVIGTLPVANGGTGLTAINENAIMCGNSSSTTGVIQGISPGAIGTFLTSNGTTSLPGWNYPYTIGTSTSITGFTFQVWNSVGAAYANATCSLSNSWSYSTIWDNTTSLLQTLLTVQYSFEVTAYGANPFISYSQPALVTLPYTNLLPISCSANVINTSGCSSGVGYAAIGSSNLSLYGYFGYTLTNGDLFRFTITYLH